jgi:DNA-binding XRE family transcriptional regulator
MTKGEKISKHRKILGLSQEDMANKLDIFNN